MNDFRNRMVRRWTKQPPAWRTQLSQRIDSGPATVAPQMARSVARLAPGTDAPAPSNRGPGPTKRSATPTLEEAPTWTVDDAFTYVGRLNHADLDAPSFAVRAFDEEGGAPLHNVPPQPQMWGFDTFQPHYAEQRGQEAERTRLLEEQRRLSDADYYDQLEQQRQRQSRLADGQGWAWLIDALEAPPEEHHRRAVAQAELLTGRSLAQWRDEVARAWAAFSASMQEPASRSEAEDGEAEPPPHVWRLPRWQEGRGQG